jgi:REP element-mobilizing transposase RayT
MPRRNRYEGAGAVHHVVPQGVNRGLIVHDDHDRRVLLDRLAEVSAAHGWRCLAYCLMSTHLHVIVRTLAPNLGRGMQKLLGWYAYGFNKRHAREGPLFQGPFWSRRIVNEEQFLRSVLYVVLNPVEAGACTHPSGYPWCSYGPLVGPAAADASFVDRSWLSEWFQCPLERAQSALAELVDAGAERLRARREEQFGDVVAAVMKLRGGMSRTHPS